jgi:tRNA-dihydrouridine synthase
VPAPSLQERVALCREHLLALSEQSGPRRALRAMRRYYPGYLRPLADAAFLVQELNALTSLEAALEVLEFGPQEALAI